MKEVCNRTFANGVVYALKTEDDYPIEVTDTFLPFYTKDAIGRKQNGLNNTELGDRSERWMIGVSTMSGCPVGCKFCFVPGTMIYTPSFEYVKIEDISDNDKIIGNQLTKASNTLGSEYASTYSVSSAVTEVMSRDYSGEIIVITTKSGNTIKCTPEHLIAVKRKIYRKKFIPAENVVIGDMLLCSTPIGNRCINWIVGWLSGFIDGDGVCSQNSNRKSYKTSVSQTNEMVLKYCHDNMINFGIRVTKIWDNQNQNYRFSFGEQGKSEFDDIVSKSENSLDFKRGYLAGFWDAEGFSLLNNKTYRVCGTNKRLLENVVNILSQFGYTSEIKLYESQKGNNHNKDCFVVESNLGWVNFCALFRPLHPKSKRLDSFYQSKFGKRSRSFSHLEEVISVSVENYTGKVYNIETTSNTYFANNILVHNCATGKLPKWRRLTAEEIVAQVEFVLSKHPELKFSDAKEYKINYTRMGEPFMNIEEVKRAIQMIEERWPGTHHYVSTVGLKGSDFSWIKGNITLQVSLHSLDEARRDDLIPIKKKMSIAELGQIRTGSDLKTTVNMTLVDMADFDIEKLKSNFDTSKFFIKVSPINPNAVSEGNNLGTGAIEGVNLV